MQGKVIDRDQAIAAYQECFASPAGQIVIQHLLMKFGFNRRSTFVPGDPHHSAANEGQRSVLVFIGQMLEAKLGEEQQKVGEG